ncbi:hypothetical protein V1477_013570 [Vespula maculifrons]|uniref:Uncharacterized protein n=1 Tax=Vespula maculifrons TaxID=7453 RepID=A0ABD2BQ01_VESMC
MYTSNRKGNAVSGRWVGLAWLHLVGEEDFVGYIGKGGSIKLEGLIFVRSVSLLVLRYLYCVIDMLMIGSNLID